MTDIAQSPDQHNIVNNDASDNASDQETPNAHNSEAPHAEDPNNTPPDSAPAGSPAEETTTAAVSESGVSETGTLEGGQREEAEAKTVEQDESALVIEKIPLQISVELGSFFIDASKTDTLEVGDVMKLTSNTPGLVRLICNEREVGCGELVDVNGRLAVQIVRNWSA